MKFIHNSAFLLALLLTSCAAKVPPAPAPNTPPAASDDQVNDVLSRFDSDSDGKLSKDEFTHGIIASFQYADQNRSLSLDKAEMGGMWSEASEAADDNKDQKISLHESLKAGEKTFQERDSNGDGYLSKEEILESMRKTEQEQNRQAGKR